MFDPPPLSVALRGLDVEFKDKNVRTLLTGFTPLSRLPLGRECVTVFLVRALAPGCPCEAFYLDR